VALAGSEVITYLPVEALLQPAHLSWKDLPKSSLSMAIQDPASAHTEVLQALSFWPKHDLLVVSKADLGVVACKAHDALGNVQPVVQAELMVMEKFAAGTVVTGLHVDPVEDVLYILFHRSGRHGEIHALDLRDQLGKLLRIFRLPDVDSADGPDADHDVVWGAVSSWHSPRSNERPRLFVVTRTPAKVFSFDLPNLRQQCRSDFACKYASSADNPTHR